MAIGLHLDPETQQAYEDRLLFSGKPHVFVLGGLSFLGRNLIPALNSAGYGVRSMAMTLEQRIRLRSLGCSTVGCGEPYSYEAIKAAARGCISAVHCGSAFVHYDTSGRGLVLQANKLVAENIIRVCRALRISKLVVQSSEAVLFSGGPIYAADETCPLPAVPLGSCAQSMQLVEELSLAANSDRLQIVIIRPRLMWGCDDEYFLSQLVGKAKSGNLRLINRGDYMTSTCHVKNACEGVICALQSGKGGEIFFLTDGKDIKFREFVIFLLSASGIRDCSGVVSRSVPLWVANRCARLCEMLSSMSGIPPGISQSGIGLVGQHMTFSDCKARELIGYKGLVTLDDGMEEIREASLRKEVKMLLGQLKQ